MLAVTFQVKSGVAAGTRVSATITDIVATDGNSDQSLNDASWAASVAAPPSGNANLAGLSCGDYALSPAFSAGTTEYSVTVPYDVSRLPLDYRAADGGADVSVSGNQLSVGVNTVVLTVTAANGASRRYTISVTRQPDPNVTLSSDASLSELTPSTGQLSPAFSPEITEYAVYVPYETSKISLSATAKDSKALGVTQPDASLKEGDNLLTVTCTAEDGATRDYTVHVVRMPAFAGTLPQIGQPEPEDPSPEEPQTQTGPFRALWTALCAPVDLPLNRWLPMYAILAAGLVILLVLLFFIGRAVGIARSRRRLPDHPAQMEPPQSPAEPESVPETPESVPEPVPEPEEAPAASEETPVPPVIVPESAPAEEAPAPEAVTPPEEEVPAPPVSSCPRARFSCWAIWNRYAYCAMAICWGLPLGAGGMVRVMGRHFPSHTPPSGCIPGSRPRHRAARTCSCFRPCRSLFPFFRRRREHPACRLWSGTQAPAPPRSGLPHRAAPACRPRQSRRAGRLRK